MEAITFEQLPQLVGQLVIKLDRIEKLLQTQERPVRNEPEELLSVDMACALLQLAKPTIYGLVSQGKLPHMKQGKKLYFVRRELMSWLEEGRRDRKEALSVAVDQALITSRKRGK